MDELFNSEGNDLTADLVHSLVFLCIIKHSLLESDKTVYYHNVRQQELELCPAGKQLKRNN